MNEWPEERPFATRGSPLRPRHPAPAPSTSHATPRAAQERELGHAKLQRAEGVRQCPRPGVNSGDFRYSGCICNCSEPYSSPNRLKDRHSNEPITELFTRPNRRFLVIWGAAMRYAGGFTTAAVIVVGVSTLSSGDSQDASLQASEGDTGMSVGTDPQGVPLFFLSGKVKGLAPGRPRTLRVRVSNPNGWRIRLLTVSVAADDASADCRADKNLFVSNYDSRRRNADSYVVSGHSAVVVPLSIHLVSRRHRNQDACENVKFRLRYSGTAASQQPS